MSDALWSGRRFRTFNVIDDYNREALGIEIRGKPMQNGYVERFNRTYRTEVLNCYVFETLGEVRRMTEEWLVR